MEERAKKKLALGFLVLTIVVSVFLAGSYALCFSVDSTMMKKWASAGPVGGPYSDLPYDAQTFSSNLEELEAIRTGTLDVASVGVELPAVRRALCRIGFRHLHLNQAARQRYEAVLLTNLKRMSGEDFGNDLAKWRGWQEAHVEEERR